MNLISWNVNGIRAAHKKGLLDWIQANQPDLLGLQEIKAEAHQIPSDLQALPGYHCYWNPARTKKGYSGTGVLSKTQPSRVEYGFGIPEFDEEGRTIVLFFESFVLLNIYFPNGQSSPERLDYKMRFYDAFLAYIEDLRQQGFAIVVCGDVNTAHTEIDLARPKANENTSGFLPIERAFLDRFLQQGYVDTFRACHPEKRDAYSWWNLRANARVNNVGWRIDYIFVDKDFYPHVADAFILPDVMGSDHCPVGIKFL